MDTTRYSFFVIIGLMILGLGLWWLVQLKQQWQPRGQIKQRKKNSRSERWPYTLRPLMTRPELILYNRLVRALPDYVVFTQVQVSRVLEAEAHIERPYEWFNKICRLSYDFVICTPEGVALAAIELDDRSHLAEHRQETDAKKDKATLDAGLAMIRWNVSAMPTHAQIQADFQIVLDAKRKKSSHEHRNKSK